MREAHASAMPPGATAVAAPVEAAYAVPAGSVVAAMHGTAKEFNGTAAVKNLSFAVPQGGLVGLIGPSGCGKTTTVRLLLGIYEPSAGECRTLGEPSHRMKRATRARLGYLPQHFVLYPNLTVDENLNFAASLYGLGPFRRRAQKARALELVGLTAHRRKLAAQLSGGMQRRLALAATMIHEPDLIFLDEPTAGIDPLLREQIWGEFRRIQGAGRTQIVTTQYVGEAEYCDSVIIMDRGEVIAAGTPNALRQSVAGGELIDLESGDFDRTIFQSLRALPGVRNIALVRENTARLTVENAAALMPQVISTVQEHGGTVQAIEERRLSFNEVFIALLARAGREVTEVAGEE
ncbi:MAG: ABC transporter ATP-binding protein [Chloroflexia bacterium]